MLILRVYHAALRSTHHVQRCETKSVAYIDIVGYTARIVQCWNLNFISVHLETDTLEAACSSRQTRRACLFMCILSDMYRHVWQALMHARFRSGTWLEFGLCKPAFVPSAAAAAAICMYEKHTTLVFLASQAVFCASPPWPCMHKTAAFRQGAVHNSDAHAWGCQVWTPACMCRICAPLMIRTGPAASSSTS